MKVKFLRSSYNNLAELSVLVKYSDDRLTFILLFCVILFLLSFFFPFLIILQTLISLALKFRVGTGEEDG
jgi:hypothetical protein